MVSIKTYGPYDQATYEQIVRCVGPDGLGVLCADNHLGYSQPIGGAAAYEDFISPSGVGYDIGCGNKAVMTDITYPELKDSLEGIMDSIARRISFGMGRDAASRVEGHKVLDQIKDSPIPFQRDMHDLAARQLGTVGSGNHYVDLFYDEDDFVWVGVHFGSRGFGHKTASHFLALAGAEDGIHAPPTLLDVNSELGEAYITGMELAGAYAYAGRDVVVDEVLSILGTEATYEVHNHHNFAWRETHFGREVWVVRKGCTPAFPGQEGFVGGSMGDISVILQGTDDPENAEGLYSTVHGAGRAMSRNEAAGKFKRKKTWTCGVRDCERTFNIDGVSAYNAAPKKGVCPDHPDAKPKKIWVTEQKSKGKIDWDATRAELSARGIVLRGGGADEAPGAYKRLPEVLAAHGETIRILHTLTPVGVAMAGRDTHDPYKD